LRLLAFDTSGAALSAAAAQDVAILAARHEALGRGHAERLLPMLEEVMAAAAWSWRDLDLVVVTVGPGNFTGLRAGIATARALALALERPVLAVGTLELAAESALDPSDARPIQVILDARRSEVYAQRFSAALVPFDEPALLSLDQVFAESLPDWRLVGDSVPGLDEWWGGHTMIETRLDARNLVRAAHRRLAGGAEPVAGTALRPLYLRPPDARVNAGASLLAATR
jgi:tRNA threonylcarbamoyl adenosine modification protein YeaZ